MHKNSNINNKYKIRIEFLKINDEIPEIMKNFLDKKHTFTYNDSSTIKQLFIWIMNNIGVKEIRYENYLKEHIQIKIKNIYTEVQLNYNLKKFIMLNNIKKLELSYIICPAGGAGAIIDTLCIIRINPNEKQHKYIPHVHVYRGNKFNRKEYVRIILENLKPMKGNETSFEELFTKKERKIIYNIIEKYKNNFIEFYNIIQNGGAPKEFVIEYNGKISIFK